MLVLKPMKRFVLMVALLAACGPEPTEAADTSLAGTWSSNANLFGVSNMKMTLVQEPKGIVSGRFTATLINPPGPTSGNVIGRNLVSRVIIELIGLGQFEGGLVEPARLRGVLSVQVGFDTITFVRTGN